MTKNAYRVGVALVLWLALVSPAARSVLESSMTLHMLVQIPLLGAVGWLAAPALPKRICHTIAAWDACGISGLVLVSVASMPWMVPLVLDAALDSPEGALFKFIGMPLLAGAPLALSWPRANFVVRGVFLVELIATVFRTGWLYLAAPQRLCTNYTSDAQQLLGTWLLGVGFSVLAVLAVLLFAGHNGSRPPAAQGRQAA